MTDIGARQLVGAYADAVNCFDEEAWAATWHADAVWDLGRGRVEGRDAIVDTWRTAMRSFDHVLQMVAHGSVSPDGTAGRWTIWELARREGVDTLMVGVYRDRYSCAGDGCQFLERTFSPVYRGRMAEAEFFPVPPLRS